MTTETESSSPDAGAVLRERREQRGVSLEEAARHTRIRKAFLENLENNQFARLPGQAYVTGFLRVYANYLGLDSDALLASVEALPVRAKAASVRSVPVSKPRDRRSGQRLADSGWGTFAKVFAVVLLFGAAIYFLPALFSGENPAGPVASEVVVRPGPVAPPATVTNQVGETQAEAPPVEEARAGEPAESPPLPSPEAVSEPAAVIPAAAPNLPHVAAGGSSLRMLAVNEGSLTIHVDDRQGHQYALSSGLDLTWKIRERVKVDFSSAGVARFWLDGRELEIRELGFFQLQPNAGE